MSSKPKQFKRPDAESRDRKLNPLNAQLKKIDQELSVVRQQLDNAEFSKEGKSTKEKLHSELKEVIKTQSDLKSKRQQIHDQIKFLDAQIKRKNTQVSELVGKNKRFQSVADIKQRLAEIDDEIATGELSLLEEKLRVKEMQSLHKLTKDFQLVDPLKKGIDEDKANIDSLKQELNSLNPKDVAAKFEAIQGQLNELNGKNQTVYDKRKQLIAKRSALYNKRDEIYAEIRKIRGDFDNEFKAYKKKMEDERSRREEEEKLSKLMEEKENKVAKLKEKLVHAKQPAFTFELESIENVLTVLDPSYVKPAKNTLEIPSSSISKPSTVKKVDAEGLIPIVKEKEEFFSRTAVSKSKKQKKKTQSAKFSLEPTMISLLAELDIRVPLSKDDVPATVESLKEKHAELVEKQPEVTEKNIAEAEEQLQKLELEYQAKEEKVKAEMEEIKLKQQETKQADAGEA